MAFTEQEKQIILYGKENGKSRQEVEQAILKFRGGISTEPEKKKKTTEPTLQKELEESLSERTNRVGEILSRPETGIVTKGVQALGQGAGIGADVIEKTVGRIPGVKQATKAIGSGMNWLATSEFSPVKHLGDILGEDKTFQEVTKLYDTDPSFKDTIDGVANMARLGMDVEGLVDSAGYAKNVTNKIVDKVKSIKPEIHISQTGMEGTKSLVKNVKKDILPTTEKFVNTEVTKALDLTQGDVKNISLSTGNDVGEFIANKNLIGSTVEETSKKLTDFYKENFNKVREEIGKVKKIYDKNEIPAFQEALGEIKKQISGKIGLTEAETEIDNLLSKKKMSLSDVQRAKELMDEHFSLYKMTGDVKEGVVKSGLVNIRKELRSFIENKVKKETGVDIKELNNNVQTARSITDAIEERSTRGLTRATISAGDMITFLTGMGLTPIGGAVALLVKKIYQSPSFKLKLVKWLDTLTDAKRLEIKNQLEKGIVPEELESSVAKPLPNITDTTE